MLTLNVGTSNSNAIILHIANDTNNGNVKSQSLFPIIKQIEYGGRKYYYSYYINT